MHDADYMQRALFLAERGRGRTSPNPMVGAVVVSADGVVRGQGFHERAGEPHAEVRALDEAGTSARGATLYSTLEPCSHYGRTGPCVARIVDAGIVRVVAAMEDPNPRVSGRGFAHLREHGVVVDVGSGAEASSALNQAFLVWVREGRPFVIVKAATSLDGCMAAAPGQRTQLTSAGANRHAHRIRAEIDAIGIGSGTLLADDPLLTARGACRVRPLTRVIFDRRLRTPPIARLLSTRDEGPVIIVTTEEDPGRQRASRESPSWEDRASRAVAHRRLADLGAEIEVARDASFTAALERLAARGISSLLLEGGAAIQRAAWDEGVVDYVRLYIAPRMLGAGGLPFLEGCSFSSAALVGRHVESIGPDVVIEGYVHGPR